MFATSAPMSPAYLSALTVSQRKKKPESCPARSFTSVTFGRDAGHPEAVDRRGDRAGDVRAMAVLVDVVRVIAGVVGIADARAVDSSRSVVQFRLSALLKFGAMSGCDPSMPVSITATITSLSPSWVA